MKDYKFYLASLFKRNYKVYLGSTINDNYKANIEDLKKAVDSLYKHVDWFYYDEQITASTPKKLLRRQLKGSLFRMNMLSIYYWAKSSLDLLLHADIQAFKQDAYLGAKLCILSGDDPLAWVDGYNNTALFLPLMSDNPDLINFLINNKNGFIESYKRTDRENIRNTLLALSGDWNELKTIAVTFLNDSKNKGADERAILEHHFYLSLANQDIEGMEIVLKKIAYT